MVLAPLQSEMAYVPFVEKMNPGYTPEEVERVYQAKAEVDNVTRKLNDAYEDMNFYSDFRRKFADQLSALKHQAMEDEAEVQDITDEWKNLESKKQEYEEACQSQITKLKELEEELRAVKEALWNIRYEQDQEVRNREGEELWAMASAMGPRSRTSARMKTGNSVPGGVSAPPQPDVLAVLQQKALAAFRETLEDIDM